MNNIDIWQGRPKGMKKCPNIECQIIFDTLGFPAKDSWSCSEWCFELTNMRHPVINRDTVSRIYLMDLDKPIFQDVLKPTQYVEEPHKIDFPINKNEFYYSQFGLIAICEICDKRFDANNQTILIEDSKHETGHIMCDNCRLIYEKEKLK